MIRKYNQRLSKLEGKVAEMKKSKSFTDEELAVYENGIAPTIEMIIDLKYIQEQMPAINPIDKGNYNDAPEGLKEISLNEWQRGMFHYKLFESDSKQVRGDQTFDLRLFDVPNFDNQKLGYAVMNDWFDKEKEKNRPENIVRFCRYGTDEQWKKFEGRFASQFAGDNS